MFGSGNRRKSSQCFTVFLFIKTSCGCDPVLHGVLPDMVEGNKEGAEFFPHKDLMVLKWKCFFRLRIISLIL